MRDRMKVIMVRGQDASAYSRAIGGREGCPNTLAQAALPMGSANGGVNAVTWCAFD